MSLRASQPTKKRSKTASFFWLTWLAFACLGAMGLRARADEAATQSNATPPCALIEDFYGDAQILDSSRTQTRVVAPNSGTKPAVYCGGWISVEQGWVQLTHRFGYSIHVGPHSFVQFLDDSDAMVLFRGQIYVEVSGGMGELRILTPNARIKAARAGVIAIFSPEEENTQLITVDGTATIANRFEDAKNAAVTVKAAESSNLDLQLLRVAPSVPKIVAAPSFKAKLVELHVPARQLDRALVVLRNRKHEAMAMYEPKKRPPANEEPAPMEPTQHTVAAYPEQNLRERYVEGSRAPARSLASEGNPNRSSAPSGNDVLLKTVGGSQDGMKILHSGRKKSKAKHAVEVEDPEAQLDKQKAASDDQEKKRLIEELSRVHSD